MSYFRSSLALRDSFRMFRIIFNNIQVDEGLPLVAQMVKNPLGDPSSILGLRRSLGEGNGYPFQYSCLENSMDRLPGGLKSIGSQRVGHN